MTRRGPQVLRISLARRLQVLTTLVAASVLLAAAVGYMGSVSTEARIVDLYDGRVVPLRELKAISDLHAIDVVDAVHKVVFGRFTAAEGANRLAVAAREIDTAWDHYAQGPLDASDRRHLEETAPLLRTARQAVDHARADMLRGDLAALDEFRRNEMYQSIDPLTLQLNALVQMHVQQADDTARVAKDDLRASRYTRALALVASALVALFVGLAYSRRLSTSLQAMQRVVRRAATGDLAARVALRGNDELAQMASDIDAMNESLGRVRREVEIHARALEVSEAGARAANDAKSAFLSSMSHELRTPLNVILGYAQLLRRARPAGDARRDLDHILEAGHHLLGLIDDVLSIAKAEAGTLALRPKPFSPARLLRGLTSLFELQARAKGLGIVVSDGDLPSDLVGDEGKLRQVLVNLIGNAIKFTAAGRVEVSMVYEGGQLAARVTDTGPGIPEDEIARLFETFYQGSRGRAAAIGAGLGLHISQTLVRLMGAEIHVESAVGVGTTFAFSVPLPVAEVPDERTASVRSLRLHARHAVPPMLVVDDREGNRDVLARLLRGIGVEVVETESGADAVARCETTSFSMVWMDLRMPDLDGWGALAALRERETMRGRPHVPVVAITASAIDTGREDLLRAGFAHLVTKPFVDDAVYAGVELVLGVTLEARAEGPEVPPAGDARWLVARLSPEERAALLHPLLSGDLGAALAIADTLATPASSQHLRAIIETFRVDALIEVLRASMA